MKTKLSVLTRKAWVAYQQGRLLGVLHRRIRVFIKSLAALALNRDIVIHCPVYISPPKYEQPVVQRIFQSYSKMKEAQRAASSIYLPSSLWQGQLDNAYANIMQSVESKDISRFHHFLANFGVWEKYTGIEEGLFVRESNQNPCGRAHLRQVISNLVALWRHYYADRKPINALKRPSHGNLSGAYIENTLVTIDSFFSEIYGSLIGSIVRDSSHPIVVELGGGSGRLAYYSLRDLGPSTYVDFDLPETLCVAAYYLMLAFPEKKTLLYGESRYEPMVHRKYDLIFMPSFEMEKLGSDNVDIFFNECSLGEMNPEAASNFIRLASLASRYIFHMNHDRYPNVYSDGSKSLLGSEYPISNNFKLLFRYPELKHFLIDGEADLSSDTVAYLYEKINS
ncbi:MAG: putative sugar O-methyltransferase [Gammaproteobacteria bacterium]|nr:putative sugar O-methyltransferase [Gammaproteobacteria bacterium]